MPSFSRPSSRACLTDERLSEANSHLLTDEPANLGQRSIAKGWDVLMKNARQQAESYVFLLDADHPAPPFIIVCDVGHCLELYADFTGTGRAYGHFPDRNRFRIYMDDLRKDDVRAHLKRIWQEPHSLDPSKEAARVTRDIAKRLAQVSKGLEERGCTAEDVAHFLMRCIFTMFAEDAELLPKGAFTQLLKECIDHPDAFAPLLEELWAKMDEPQHERRFYSLFKTHLRHFNGSLFKRGPRLPAGPRGDRRASGGREAIPGPRSIPRSSAPCSNRPSTRPSAGSSARIIRPAPMCSASSKRPSWSPCARIGSTPCARPSMRKRPATRGRPIAIVRAFHRQLCATRVLDPACGTGNFFYVSLELMKKLEGEVLEALAQLGEPESMGLDRETVDPHQFLGLELNPRAAAIAELVVWIGYLQQHYRNRTGHPSEPILRAFENINLGRRQGYDAVLTWDGYPVPQVVEKDGRRIETYPNARRPEWPEAEFIVGNPPFIGGKELRARATG